MSDWYETLEPGIRDVVRLLRNNGYNTYYSCEHAMVVEIDMGSCYNSQVLRELSELLQQNGYPTHQLQLTYTFRPGMEYGSVNLRVALPMKSGYFCGEDTIAKPTEAEAELLRLRKLLNEKNLALLTIMNLTDPPDELCGEFDIDEINAIAEDAYFCREMKNNE